MTDYHIAQLNIGKMVAPTDSPIVAEFMARLDEINALAEASPGFVWRLQSDDGNATDIRIFDDDLLLINMSVWETIDDLYQYTYYSDHVEVFRKRAQWFEKMSTPHMTLWWVAAGVLPTLEEAKAKLDLITEHGSSPLAFTFKDRFTVQQMQAYHQKDPK